MVTQSVGCAPGGDAWRAWLDETDQRTFRFTSRAGSFSGRREAKAARSYWYAYRKSGGRLRKAYLGRTEDLTLERLDTVATQLSHSSGAVAVDPGEPSTDTASTHLPRPTTELIGRSREVAAVTERLLDTGARLVTLIGPGGTGKTRLSIAVAEQVSARFADGVWFIDLSAIQDADLVIREIARQLGILDVGEVPVRERLQHQLATRHMLLVLDNVEQILGAAPDVDWLLGACPCLVALVTSREPLHLDREISYWVPPLTVPNLAVPVVPDQLRDIPAVDLFLARARDAGARIELTPHAARDLAELCVRLDGLPLAIELAAARARLLRPRDMLVRITRQLELLRDHVADRAERHQSLRAAIGWSYDLLTDAERQAFRCLSVFSGGCTLDAAEGVLGTPDALDLLASLIDKSLVRSEAGARGESRLTMLETIRSFGLEQLSQAGEERAVRRRHADYHLNLVRPPTWDALDLPEPDWLGLVAAEHDNMHAALRWCLEHDAAAGLGLELATSLQGFWMLQGYLREGLSWLEQAIAHAPGRHPQVMALAHHAAGQLAWRQGEYDRAEQHYAAGLALRRALGDTVGCAISLQGLASVARDRGDLGDSVVLWQECLAVFRASGNRVRTVRASLNLAIALHLAGQSDRAASLLEECAQQAQPIGQVWAEATALTYLGLIALEVGQDRARSAAFARAALPLAPRVSDAWVTVHLLELTGFLAAGDETTGSSAGQLFAASEALRERIGARLHPAFVAGHARWLAHLADRGAHVREPDGSKLDPEAALGLAQAVLRGVDHRPARYATRGADSVLLSSREREVAALVAEGLTSRQIADRLIVGERTIETHVDHIRAKLGVRSRAQIAAWAVERGLMANQT